MRSLYEGSSGYSSGALEYITAAWDEEDVYATPTRVPAMIVVGNGQEYEADVIGRGMVTYINVPLKSNTKYTIITRYDINNDIDPTQVSNACVFTKGHLQFPY